MSKLTLLELTQRLLAETDGEDITSVNDTVEATQAALFFQSAYEYIVDTQDLPIEVTDFHATSVGASRPTTLTLPTNVLDVRTVRYNVDDADASGTLNYRDLIHTDIDTFISLTNGQDDSLSTVEKFNVNATSDLEITVRNDRMPTYYCIYDDTTMLMDSYDSATDATGLDGTKCVIQGHLSPTFTFGDSFTPNLSDRLFSLLYNEAKLAYIEDIQQKRSVNTERRARRLWSSSQKHQFDHAKSFRLHNIPNFARRGRGG